MRTNDHVVVAGASIDLDRWQRGFDQLMLRMGLNSAASRARWLPPRSCADCWYGCLGGLQDHCQVRQIKDAAEMQGYWDRS